MSRAADRASHPPRLARWVERWWQGEAGILGRALEVATAPAEWLFRGAARARGWGYDRALLSRTRLDVPVVSVGNLAVGGAGKTPVTRWLVGQLRERGARPAVLHGGYAEDEPMLHRLWHPDVPVIAKRDRILGAEQAIAAGATALVLDDGFQHRRLERDLDLVLVAAESWGACHRLLPRGPWRESPRALGRAQTVVVTRKVASAEAARAVGEALAPYAPGAVHVRLQLRPSGWSRLGVAGAGNFPGGDVVAVTAIAHPDLFVANAKDAGARVGAMLFFPDHHGFTWHDVERIRALAAGRPVVTTAKDAVKLGPLAAELELWVLEQEVVVEAGGEALAALLDELISEGVRR